MRYDHRVKIGGKWYKAGEEVPALNTTKAEKKVSEVTEAKADIDPSVVTKKSYNRKK